jgi:hypothetical protein
VRATALGVSPPYRLESKNFMNTELPSAVRRLTDVVGNKLGRPAHCRKVRNSDEWYIYDPVFSFVQQGMKKGNAGYRVGYMYKYNTHSVWFRLVHSPIVAKLFKRNLVLSSMIEVLRSTVKYRRRHYLQWSSKEAVRSGSKRGCRAIYSDSFDDFVGCIEEFDSQFGFVDDLFPKKPTTGKGKGNAPVAGNTFYLKLCDKSSSIRSLSSLTHLVDHTWQLFLCLYPVKPIESRTAGLARKLRSRGIPRICEFESIALPRGLDISPLCRGEVQGAHIKPDALGGSDLSFGPLCHCGERLE